MNDTEALVWKRLRSEEGQDLRVFRLRFDELKNPRNDYVLKAVVLEANDWVTVVAVTPEKKIVVVDQYRFGRRCVSTEIPAGIIETGESPQMAGQRELLEETGYSTDRWTSLGWIEPNPAFLNNLCHQFLALDVRKTHEAKLDEGEALQVRELTLQELQEEICRGNIRNSFSLLGLSKVFDLWTDLKYADF
ncbi:NUDIX hydrolase [candidate division KSB3 bacterium]|uniref:NUDIX hydrolase n=1 Tax=candidate division KSB3 bacterium TaxID=2044937 RepID=A0A2G6E1H3_9BACT|nr:MAG: NUDIX hydrolase [candidate division KSB3 bacterium]PIE28327.1 MAG: NUDIX hydrolase [candidate division KSB3 bacterium]